METNISNTTYTNTLTKVLDYSVNTRASEGVSEQDETYYDNPYFTKWLGYYKTIPELKKAIDAYATWVLGQGYNTDTKTRIILSYIDGWGEDTFGSILWNMLVTKKFHGDAYAEIIRNEKGDLINIKPLDPSTIRVVVNKQGRIKRYEQFSKTGKKQVVQKYKPIDIFHISNDRIVDEIHGTSVCESVQWIVDARNEAMSDWRRVLHRSTIRILYVDEDNPTKINTLKTQYADAMNRGEVLILPGKPSDASFQELTAPPIQAFITWIQYLENFFYQSVGVPKSITGGTQDSTEASSKVGMVAFDPIYLREITDLEADIWNQLGIKISFVGQKSMMDNINSDQMKNTGQTKMEYQGAQ